MGSARRWGAEATLPGDLALTFAEHSLESATYQSEGNVSVARAISAFAADLRYDATMGLCRYENFKLAGQLRFGIVERYDAEVAFFNPRGSIRLTFCATYLSDPVGNVGAHVHLGGYIEGEYFMLLHYFNTWNAEGEEEDETELSPL